MESQNFSKPTQASNQPNHPNPDNLTTPTQTTQPTNPDNPDIPTTLRRTAGPSARMLPQAEA